jgi:hypothetical protein
VSAYMDLLADAKAKEQIGFCTLILLTQTCAQHFFPELARL